MTANFIYPKKAKWRRGRRVYSSTLEGTSPSAGIGIIRNRHSPKQAQGRFLVNELSTHGFLGTYRYDIGENGTRCELQWVTPHLVATRDPFDRPTAMAFGADGAMYVLDFSSPVIENTGYSKRDQGRDHSHGRVWRIIYPANPLLQPLGIVDRPSRPLRYRQNQVDYAIDRMAQLVEDEHIRVCLEAVPACGFCASGRAPEVVLQAARFPMDSGMQRALDDTMNFFEGSDSIRP